MRPAAIVLVLLSLVVMAGTAGRASAFEEPLDPSTCPGPWNPFLNLSGFGEEDGTGQIDRWFKKVWPPQVCQGGVNQGQECADAAGCPGSACGEWCLPEPYRTAIDPQYWCGYGVARYHNEQDDDGDGIPDAFGDPSDDVEVEDFFPARVYKIHSDPGAKIPARQPVDSLGNPAPITDMLVYVVFPNEVPVVPTAENPLPSPRVYMQAAGGHFGDAYREDQNVGKNVRLLPADGNNSVMRAKLDLGFHFVRLLYRGHEGPLNLGRAGYFKPTLKRTGDYIPGFDTIEAQEAAGGEMHDVVVGARFVLSGIDFPAPAYSVYSGGSHSSLTGFHLARRVALDRIVVGSAVADTTVMENGIVEQSTAPALFFRDLAPPDFSNVGNDICYVPPALPDCSALYPRTYPDCYYEADRCRTHYEERHSLVGGNSYSQQELVGCAGSSHVNHAGMLACETPGDPDCDYCTSPINGPPITRKILIYTNYDDPVAPSAGPRAYYRKWWEDTENWDWYCASNPCHRRRPLDLEIHFFQYTSVEGYRTLGCMYPTLHDCHGCTPNPDFAPGPWGYEDALQKVRECFLGIRDPRDCPRRSSRLVPSPVRGIQFNRIRVVVEDPSGTPIAGATVSVRDFPSSLMYPDTPVVRSTRGSGKARLKVPVGWKTVDITAPGYEALLGEHIYVVKRRGLRDATTGRRIREYKDYDVPARFIRGRCVDGAPIDCNNADADSLNDYDQSGVFVLTPVP